MDRVRFALVGVGRAGRDHARNLAGCIPDAEIVSPCDADAAALEETGQGLGVAAVHEDFRADVRDAQMARTDGLKAVEIVAAANRSLASGEPIELGRSDL